MRHHLNERQAEYEALIAEARTKAIGMFTLDDLEFLQEKFSGRFAGLVLLEQMDKFYSESRITRLKKLLHR